MNNKNSQIRNLKLSQATKLVDNRIKHKNFTPQTSRIIKCTKLQLLNFKNSRFKHETWIHKVEEHEVERKNRP